MNITPLISVIIPFYKVERYLEETIESVLRQTYTNWELLLLDDGSPDGSTGIALRYALDYPDKIHYFHHPDRVNKGLPATRNLGVRYAKGDWLALLDADDYWLPEKLAHQVSITQQFPAVSMICGASKYWYSWFDDKKDDVIIAVGAPPDVVIEPPHAALMLYPLGEGAAPCPCSVMIRKKTAIRYGAFEEQFKGKFSLYEDQAFFIKIYLHEPIYVSSRTMDRYRQRNDSIMSRASDDDNYHEVRLFYLNWLEKYLDDENITYPTVREKLNAALRVYKKSHWHKMKQSVKRYMSYFKN